MKTVDINAELYIPILKALNVDADEHGHLTMKYPDRTAAAVVGGKNLVLPVPEILRALPENAVVFHPMSENVARGDSSMQNYLKTLVTFKVSFSICYLAQQLYTIAADHKLHEKLTGDQLAILTILPDADTKGATKLENILATVDMTKVRVYNVFNKRKGELDGETYNRVAVASFPLLSEMLKPEGTVWGHRDVRKRDLKDFKALFDYIIPEWFEEDRYSAASDSMEAPSFHALMSSFAKIMEPLVRITKIYGNLFKDKTEDGDIVDIRPYVDADLSWIRRFDNLSKYRSIVPVMTGNDGEPLAGSTETQEITKNPKSIAPAFTKQNVGQDIRLPETPAPQQPPAQPASTHQPMVNNPQPTSNTQQGPGVSGFGNYSTHQAQRPPMNNYPPMGSYPNQQGWGNPQQMQQQQGSGVAGFGNYNPNGNFPMQNQGGWGYPGGNPYGYQNGQFQNQQIQQQSAPASPFDEWNRNAEQQQMVNMQQQAANVNPYTMPSAPVQQQGWGNPNMGMGYQQGFVGQPNMGMTQQQLNQAGWTNNQQMNPGQWNNNPYQGNMNGQQMGNPYVPQQSGGMFKVRR